jgi:SPP1 family predicted phage head-tail adaptor
MIGSMDNYVRLERRTLTRDNKTGEMVASWALYMDVWANRYDRTGRTNFQGNQDVGYREDVARIYFDPNVNATNFRLIEDGKLYEITSVKEVSRRRYMDLTLLIKDNEAP